MAVHPCNRISNQTSRRDPADLANQVDVVDFMSSFPTGFTYCFALLLSNSLNFKILANVVSNELEHFIGCGDDFGVHLISTLSGDHIHQLFNNFHVGRFHHALLQ